MRKRETADLQRRAAALDDYDWAVERVTRMCASAFADAAVYGKKLLKGFGYPNEAFGRAQDARALEIVLAALSAREIARLHREIAALAVQGNECLWTPHDDEWSGVRWETACGHAFVFIEDGPAENETNYCCYCGGKLAQAERPPEETR